MTKGRALHLADDFKPLQFFLKKPLTVDTKNGIAVLFVFVRRLMGSILNVFLPSSLIVVVSWVSFWIGVEAAPARVALSVTSLLTLCTQVQNHKSQLPPLSYIIALDIWLFVCIFMVFATLVEFALSYNSYVKKRVNSSKKSREIFPAPGSPNPTWVMKVDSIDNNSGEPSDLRKSGCCFSSNGVTRIDILCRILFPLTFAVFSVSYWAYYLEGYNKE